MDLALITESVPRLLGGAWLTVQLITLSLILGLIGAVGLAVMRLSGNVVLSSFAYGYVFVFRGTPLLVQIFLVYYGLSQFEIVRESFLWPILREAYWCAILAFTMNTAAYTSEIIRGGILSVSRGQIEAARACGMSSAKVFRRIILPQAIRQGLPAYGNEMILMVKASSLASTITLMEITGIAKAINSRTFAPFEVFAAAGIIYLSLNFMVTRGIRYAERRLTPYLRHR